MGEATDAHRVAKAHTPLEGKLLFREMSGREEISRMFDYRAELLAEEDSGVDPKAVLGQSVTIELEIQGGGSRYIDTQCTRFGYIGHETAGMRKTKFYRYEARLRPWTWYMTLASCCRVFQNQKVPDIVRTVLGAYPYPVDWRLSRGYREWEYCVQYQETDFNFMSRLLEHEGIYYWFEHAMGSHTLVLADDIGAHSSLAGYATIPHLYTDQMVVPDEEWIDHWRMVQEVNSGMFETDDYDLKLPQPHLRVIEMNERPFPNGSYAIYDWPGGYWQTDDGQQYARIRLQELQQPQEIVSAESNARGLTPGYLFNLERCPRRDQDREYLILGVGCYIRDNPYHTGGGAPADWQFTFTAQPSSIPYRPARLTTKPRTMGPQTAVVVGEKGKDEEIVCDEYGRVRVQFHWDHDHSYDEESSCWMRVASGWAGSNWGMISLPRVNQEVIVDFINGDPDYPIIIGRVYNGEHKTPYTLPRWKEYATWKSRSTKHGGNNDWNEIRYYDYKGKEQIYIQAQWRMDMRVKWNKYLTVKEHWHSLIGKGYYLTTGGNYDLHVKGKLYEHVDDEINWSSGAEIKIAGEKDVKISADQSLEGSASMNIVLDAGMELCLKGPGGFISIGPAGVTIQGTMVNINSGGAASSASDFEAEHPYDATECDTGEPGYLDKPPKGGGWAKRGSTKGGPRHGGSGPSPSPGPGPAPGPPPLRNDYQVVPDDFIGPLGPNQIRESDMKKLEQAWDNINKNQGMVVNGSKADQDAWKAMMRDQMRNSPTLRQTISDIGNDTAHPITVNAGRNQPGCVFDTFGNNNVDLSDLDKASATPRAGHPNETTRGELMTHFLDERHFAATHPGSSFADAHADGIAAQNRYRAERGQSPVTSQVFAGKDAAGNDIGRTNYADGTHQDTHIDSSGNIVSIDPP